MKFTKKITGCRQHPAALFRYTAKNFRLLLIPAVRTLLAYSFDIRSWMHVKSYDIIIIALIFLQAGLRWYLITFEITGKCFKFHSGFIARMTSEIPYESISAVTSEKNPFQRTLRCADVLIDTDAQAIGLSKTSPDIRLMMRDSDIDSLFSVLSERDKNTGVFRDKISKGSLVVFSLLFSSALSGVAFISTLVARSGDIIGDTLEDILLDTLNSAAETVSENLRAVILSIPPAAAAAAIVIVIGWFISFIGNLLRHMNFTIEKHGNSILIRDGSIIKRRYYISANHINYADLRQSLLMKLFGIMSVNVNCSGYGKGKNEIPVFIPVSAKSKVVGIMKRIIPGYDIENFAFEAGLRYILRYTCIPSVCSVLLTFMAGSAVILFPEWYDMIFFSWIMLEIPAVWMILAKAITYCTGGISCNSKIMVIRYSRFYEFHTVIVPKDRIAKISLSRNPLQRLNGSCDMIIYTNSEYTKSHAVRGIIISEALTLLDLFYGG